MASIEKRETAKGATTYIVKWREPDGKHRTKGGFTSKKAAEDYAALEVEPRRRRGRAVDPSAGKMLFRAAAADWLLSRADLKETTRAAYADALASSSEHTVKRHKRLADLRIDNTFGDYPLNSITRDDIRQWVTRMSAAGKKPSTIRNAYFLVKQVLAHAVADGRLDANPADYVKLPTDHNTGRAATHDDPAQFLTAAQVSALVAATPWPYNVMVNLAAWSGLRAAEMTGLQVGDVLLPPPSLNPNARSKPGQLRVERTAVWFGSEWKYIAPKTKGSRRRVPLPAATTALLADYLASHPRASEPTAPLFPGMALVAQKPTGLRASGSAAVTPLEPLIKSQRVRTKQEPGIEPGTHRAKALRQASALAMLSLEEAEARLALKWDQPLRHATFYKAVYRPTVLRANRLSPASALPAEVSWHALRHTYASLCIAAGRPPLEIARFMGHAKVTTTLTVYAHLFNTDDHADAMSALDVMATGGSSKAYGDNVIPLRG